MAYYWLSVVSKSNSNHKKPLFVVWDFSMAIFEKSQVFTGSGTTIYFNPYLGTLPYHLLRTVIRHEQHCSVEKQNFTLTCEIFLDISSASKYESLFHRFFCNANANVRVNADNVNTVPILTYSLCHLVFGANDRITLSSWPAALGSQRFQCLCNGP